MGSFISATLVHTARAQLPDGTAVVQQTPSAPAAAPPLAANPEGLPAGPRLEEAKAMFRRGVALLEAGDTERALEAFLRSRELVPSAKNTVNAAICLERLGRFDEALEMYEEVLARFAAKLDVEDRKSLAPVMAALRTKIGYLDLSSNVDGLVVVDGRSRGRLPLTTSLRLLPGTRRVRVVKDGYKTFEQTLSVVAGQTGALDAELQPLAGSGAVRIESAGGTVVDVLVDGVRVGATPFEGTLSAGTHVLMSQSGDVGSAPEVIDVLAGRTLLLRVSPKALGGLISIVSEPGSAALFLGSVPLGRGRWQGRLPLGNYALAARETGYFDATLAFAAPSRDAPSSVRVVLRKNPKHPRWPQPSPLRPELVALVGPWFAPTLDAGSEQNCPSSCAGGPVAWGVHAALGAGLRHASGWGGQLLVGYAGFEQHFARIARQRFADSGEAFEATYLLDQRETAAGVTVGLRGTLQRSLPFGLEYFGALGGGLFVAHYRTSVDGSAFTNDGLAPVLTSGIARVWGASPFVSAALGLEKKVAVVSVRLALGAWFFPTSGPKLGGPTLGVSPSCDAASPPGAVGCAPQSHALADEHAHGSFWAFTPEVGASYFF